MNNTPMGERPKLAVRKREPHEDSSATQSLNPVPTTPVHRPSPRPPRDNLAFPLIIAVTVSVLVIWGGYKGFNHLHDQVKRVALAETECAKAGIDLAEFKSTVDNLIQRKDHLVAESLRIEEAAKLEFIQKKKLEQEATLASLRTRLIETKASIKEQNELKTTNAQMKLLEAKTRLLEAENNATEIKIKIDTMEIKNRQMRDWLRTHNATLHPSI